MSFYPFEEVFYRVTEKMFIRTMFIRATVTRTLKLKRKSHFMFIAWLVLVIG